MSLRAGMLLTMTASVMMLYIGISEAQPLPRESVEADVSTRSVSITSSFTGTEIVVFGTVENSRQPSAEAGTYDVVIVLEGTPAPAVVRKKDRIAGLWFNATSVRFASFPSYYAIASTRPIDEVAPADVLNANAIGFQHIRMVPAGRAVIGNLEGAVDRDFRNAVLRLKEREGLYVKADYGVTFIGRSLFRATISLPPNVPVGPLTSRVYLFQDGKILGNYQSKVTMERAGIERFLHDSAYGHPLLYALATIALAAFSGLAAAYAFQRAAQA
jgi:uncharacterized protein (TIGR02186 family)